MRVSKTIQVKHLICLRVNTQSMLALIIYIAILTQNSVHSFNQQLFIDFPLSARHSFGLWGRDMNKIVKIPVLMVLCL